jgi:hypothetical protein
MTKGERLLAEMRRERRRGDPRLTDADKAILRRITTGDLADEFADALSADLVAGELLGGPDDATGLRGRNRVVVVDECVAIRSPLSEVPAASIHSGRPVAHGWGASSGSMSPACPWPATIVGRCRCPHLQGPCRARRCRLNSLL